MYTRVEKEFRDQLVRNWRDLSVAALERWVWQDGNSFEVEVSGAAAVGAYTINIVLVDGGATIPITFTRVAENNTAIGAGLDARADVLIAVDPGGGQPTTVLRTFIRAVSNAAGVLFFVVQPGCPRFRVTTSAPGGASLVLRPNDEFPINYVGLGLSPLSGPRTKLHITVIPVNSSGVPLDPGAATVDITARRMIDRNVSEGEDRPCGVSNSQTTAMWNLGDAWTIEANGGRWCFALDNFVDDAITGLYALELWVREVTA